MQPSKGAQAPLVPNFIHANQHKLTLIKTHKTNHCLLSELLLLDSTKRNWVHYLPPSQDAFQTSNVCTYAHIYEQVSKTPVIQARLQTGTYLGMLCVFEQWNLNSVTVPVGPPKWPALWGLLQRLLWLARNPGTSPLVPTGQQTRQLRAAFPSQQKHHLWLTLPSLLAFFKSY